MASEQPSYVFLTRMQCGGEDLVIGPEKTGKPLEPVEPSVRAILVKMDGRRATH